MYISKLDIISKHIVEFKGFPLRVLASTEFKGQPMANSSGNTSLNKQTYYQNSVPSSGIKIPKF